MGVHGRPVTGTIPGDRDRIGGAPNPRGLGKGVELVGGDVDDAGCDRRGVELTPVVPVGATVSVDVGAIRNTVSTADHSDPARRTRQHLGEQDAPEEAGAGGAAAQVLKSGAGEQAFEQAAARGSRLQELSALGERGSRIVHDRL